MKMNKIGIIVVIVALLVTIFPGKNIDFQAAEVTKLSIRNIYNNFVRSEKIITIEDDRMQLLQNRKLDLELSDIGYQNVNGVQSFGTRIVQASINKTWNVKTALLSGQEMVGNPPISQNKEIIYLNINENDVPEVLSIETPMVGVNDPIILNGPTTLNQLLDSYKYKLQVGNVNAISQEVVGSGGKQVKLVPAPGSQFALGMQDISITRINNDQNYTLENIFVYKQAIKVIGEINLNGMTMFPIIGETESDIQFTRTVLNKYDVYFIKDINNLTLYNSNNKVKDSDFQWISKENQDDMITVKVPSSLTPGGYHIVFTNSNSLVQGVTAKYIYPKQQYLVVQLSQQPVIANIQPNFAPAQTETEVSITGYFFAPHNIPGFVPDQPLNLHSYQNGKMDYGVGNLQLGEENYRVKVERDYKVIIGNMLPIVTFEFDTINMSKENKFTINTIPLQLDQKEIRDVIIQMTTTIRPATESSSPAFSGEMIKEVKQKQGFIYEPATEIPKVNSLIPIPIPIEVDGDRYCINANLDKLSLAIKGEKFLVTRYMDAGKEIIRYPVVNIGGKLINNNIDYSAEDYKPLSFMVLNGSNVVEGLPGNETGDTILIELAAGSSFAPLQGFPVLFPDNRVIEIRNPLRKSMNFSVSYRFELNKNIFEIINNNDFPHIKSVNPSLVNTDGGESVVISGSNLRTGANVFIDGKTVAGVKISGNNTEISFVAPAGRSGVTQLQVANPGGGLAVHPFTYTKTYTRPGLFALNPRSGTTGTMVVLKGENFLAPDPSVKVDTQEQLDEFLNYRLIGSRILFNGYDINSYNFDKNKIIWQKYVDGENGLKLQEPVFLYSAERGLKITPNFESTILRDSINKKYYVINKNIRHEYSLEDGLGTSYKISYDQDNNKVIAYLAGERFEIEQSKKGELRLRDSSNNLVILEAWTPYLIEKQNSNGIVYDVIVGQRAFFINDNTIIISIPPLINNPWTGDGDYDISIVNPDTRKATISKAFKYYSLGRTIPKVIDLQPFQGTVAGGNIVRIIGPDDQDESTAFTNAGGNKTRVFIGNQEVPVSNVNILPGEKEMLIKVPPCLEDLKKMETDRITLPITLVNPDGGSFSIAWNRPLMISSMGQTKIAEGYTYIVPGSHPRLDANGITPAQGSAGGGVIVDLTGFDFREFEPFMDLNGNGVWDESLNNGQSEPYTDLDGNGQYTSKNPRDEEGRPVESVLLPQVYFGNSRATLLDYNSGWLQVLTPPGQGSVSVYVINNDGGISNQLNYKYVFSNPIIKDITPNIVKKQGGDKIEISGSGFDQRAIKLLKKEKNEQGYSLLEELSPQPLLRVGNRTNVALTKEMPQSGWIKSNFAAVVLEGGLRVEYNSSSNVLKVNITTGEQIYQQIYKWDGNKEVFINTTDLINEEGQYFLGEELIRLDISDGRIIVDAGYAAHTILNNSSNITAYSPYYFTVGKVDVSVINPDMGKAQGQIEYKNPDSNPKIINMTRDTISPLELTVNGVPVKILRINYKGQSEIEVLGSDFRTGALIKIGNILTFTNKDIRYSLPDKLCFTLPTVNKNLVGNLYPVLVINEDGAVANSSQMPSTEKPIYIQFTSGETNPIVDRITPSMGSALGGTEVIITGKDFRNQVNGYENGSLKVFFGEYPATEFILVDSNTIKAVSPAAPPGKKDVIIENPDGERARISHFNWISSPQINKILNNENVVQKTVSITGGEEVLVNGTGFLPGARVVWGPQIQKTISSDDDKIFISQAMSVNNKNSYELTEYKLTSGIESLTVEWIDTENIKIKVPASDLHKQGIIVINPDGGSSSIYQGIKSDLPGINIPEGVKAEIIYDKMERHDLYIVISWDTVANAQAYEIWVIENNQTKPIGITDKTTYVFNELKTYTDYKFVVKAIGEFSYSKGSQESNRVRTGRYVGMEDTDGEVNEYTSQNKQGQIALVNVGTSDFNKKPVIIDLTRGVLAGSSEVVILMPQKVINSVEAQNIEIRGADFFLRLNPAAFRLSSLQNYSNKGPSGVRFRMAPANLSQLKAPANTLAQSYYLEAQAFVGKESTTIDYLTSNITVGIDYDENRQNMRRLKDPTLAWYDEYNQQWINAIDGILGYNGQTKMINRLGAYTVVGGR